VIGLPKKEILMAYIIRSCDLSQDGISKNGNLMAYVSRSCDLPKVRNVLDGWLM
jgi:hypothetical protein